MVLVDHGAANDFIVFYTLVGGRLLPMTGGPHDPADPPIVWDVGGTVGAGYSEADCISHGHVGVIIRWPDKRGRWQAKGTRYTVEPTRFVRSDVYELASERRPDRLPSDWPRVRRPEFESCGGITLPRQ
jgi:hypothetical protein